MRQYIIIARSICGIGGAEIYVRNKLNFLHNNNYQVTIISCVLGTIKISELEYFKKNIIPECINDPFLYTDSQRKRILKKLLNSLNITEGSEVIIESSFIQGALWGELLASVLNCRNFCFLVDDSFRELSDSERDFLVFKLKRKELVGITKNSLELLFKQKYLLLEDEHYFLNFTCINSIEHINNYFNFYHEQYDITIGSIGRINKPCVPIILSEIKKFASQHTNKKILFVLFGGGDNEKKLKKQYIKSLKNIDNLTFIITGEFFPIPYDCVNKFDLFISTAGSARATYNSGIPTLSVELMTGVPLGLLGINTNSTQYRMDEDKIIWLTIKDALSSFFINNEIDLNDIRGKLTKKTVVIDYATHLSFMNKSIKENEIRVYDFTYYRVNNNWKCLISCIYRLFGAHVLVFLMGLYKKLKLPR